MSQTAHAGKRTGTVAVKVGMTRFFDDNGHAVPVTVLSLDGCQVVAHRTTDKDGYVALQLGAGDKKPKNTSKAMRGHFAKGEIEPKRRLKEFKVAEDNLLPIGAELRADHFQEGQKVDVQGTTKGKGFAGAMKRWNFGGLRATHGVSVSHRSHGSTGQRQDPGRTFKGKKMAGHLGQETVTTLNLTVWRVDVERGLVLVKGCVPGTKGDFVSIRDAVKAARPHDVPVPGAFFPSNRSAIPWSGLERAAPDGSKEYVLGMQEAWRALSGTPTDPRRRAVAAYAMYANAWSLMADTSDPAGRKGELRGVLMENLPAAALELAADEDRDVANAGALLLALLRLGPQQGLWLSGQNEAWPTALVQTVREAVAKQVEQSGIRFFVRHSLKRRTEAGRTTVSGRVDVLGRLPSLDLGGPIATQVPDWAMDTPLSLTVNWLEDDDFLDAAVRFKARPLTQTDRTLGVIASGEVEVIAKGDGGHGILKLRPSLGRRPLDTAFAHISSMPAD